MPRSFERINFALRPGKNIERKMLCEAFSHLSPFGRIDAYRYIGFPSTFFSDFLLVHRTLGINNMIGIEHEETLRDRFEINRPLGCIQIEYGESSAILPSLQWDAKSIVWLDYDGKLDAGILTDVGFVCSSATSGSVLVVTVNAHADDPLDGRVTKLRRRVGEQKIPTSLTDAVLGEWGTAQVSRRILENEVNEQLSNRNGVRSVGSKLLFYQLFHFQYSDGARMLTFGGVIYEEGQVNVLSSCGFENLPFVRNGDDPFRIVVPNLTLTEMRSLDRQLPAVAAGYPTAPAIPRQDVENYTTIYRYFPRFVEAEL